MNYLLKTSSARKDITSRSGGSTRYNIGQEGIAASSVHLPTLPEQQKIAAFLTAVDGRQAGLRRQVAALERYKRGVMQGVCGEGADGRWVKVKVSEVYSFFSTNSLSWAQLNYDSGKYRNIHYGDIHTQFSQYLDVRHASVPYINMDVTMKDAAYKHPVQAGDILLADASEDVNDIGKATEVVDAGNIPLYAGLHTIHARPKQGTIAPEFGTLLFQSPTFRRQVYTAIHEG
ncbi:restriction endonuclease subunit S [Neolewinella sp.]|uniref:restriction endonuclease subunit S n=1 Tax=Neolewinella sp. TaxID=2993543 RepID=UPI003B523DC7